MADDEKPDLEALLEHYGSRTKPGRNSYMTSCPLHDDRTPSLSVLIDDALWKCHSCGESGDSYTLIQKKEGGLSFVDARAFAARLGLDRGGSEPEEKPQGSRYVSGRRGAVKRDARRSAYIPAWKRTS